MKNPSWLSTPTKREWSEAKKRYNLFIEEAKRLYGQRDHMDRERKARILAKKYNRDINDVYDIFNQLTLRGATGL
jgi:hypothetical protein